MILLMDGEAEHVSVTAPKVGRQYEAIVLQAEDFAKLARLPAGALLEWVNAWWLGFPPDVNDDAN